MIGFKATQSKRSVADTNRNRLSARKARRNDTQLLASDETQFQQSQSHITDFGLRMSKIHLLHDDSLPDRHRA